ncbi:MAG: DUF4147 domain-containing protein [Spirochaetes bacterium]|nr:DUF4147 domain-containing protein [Spirochaetota bacterium]
MNKTLNYKKELKELFHSACTSADPGHAIERNITLTNNKLKIANKTYSLNTIKRIFIYGFGKASLQMAKRINDILQNRIYRGIVLSHQNRIKKIGKIKILKADHPLPGKNTFENSKILIDSFKAIEEDDLVIFLISGGGSAMFEVLPDTIDPKNYTELLKKILKCPAPIEAINRFRTFISQVKGSQVLSFIKAERVHALIVSDVIEDDLKSIASGPTVPITIKKKEATDFIKKYGLSASIPEDIASYIQHQPAVKKMRLAPVRQMTNSIISNNRRALKGIEEKAKKLKYNTQILTCSLQGEARYAGIFLSAIAKYYSHNCSTHELPYCIISGGETTVTVKGKGKGGRNQELALGFAGGIKGYSNIFLLSAGTDGIDGFTDAAGAFVSEMTLKKAHKKKLSVTDHLDNNDSYHYFKRTDDLFITGPTGTNVMDVQIILIFNKKRG